MRGRFALLVLLLLLVQGLSGCTSIFVAHVPPSALTAGWEENEEKREQEKQFLGLGLVRTTRVYEFTESRTGGPYPAFLTVIGIRILGGASRSDLIERLDESLQEVLEEQNVDLDRNSRREGQRTLGQGQASLYFTYEATSQPGGIFFDQGRKLRILGEVFNDDASGITVLLVGIAQITGGSILTGQQNTSQWARIVGDPGGTIEGHVRSDGLAYRVVSHG